MDSIIDVVLLENCLVVDGQEIVDVHMKFYLSILYHIDLLCMILLLVKDISNVQFQGLKFRNNLKDKTFVFIFEKVKFLNDITMSHRYDLSA